MHILLCTIFAHPCSPSHLLPCNANAALPSLSPLSHSFSHSLRSLIFFSFSRSSVCHILFVIITNARLLALISSRSLTISPVSMGLCYPPHQLNGARMCACVCVLYQAYQLSGVKLLLSFRHANHAWHDCWNMYEPCIYACERTPIYA